MPLSLGSRLCVKNPDSPLPIALYLSPSRIPHYLSLLIYRSLTYLGLLPVTYRFISIPLCHPIQASLLSILIDIHFQTHWVSLSNPLGFTFKPIGFHFQIHWVSFSNPLGFVFKVIENAAQSKCFQNQQWTIVKTKMDHC